MTNAEVAKAFTALCAKGEFEQAGKLFWSEDIVSCEPMEGPMARITGRQAVEGKGVWWYENHEIHSVKVEGPYVHGDQFIVRFTMEVTPKGGARIAMDEMGLYTVNNGKVIEERFFFGGG